MRGDVGPKSSKVGPDPKIPKMSPKVPGGPQALPKNIKNILGPRALWALFGPTGPLGPRGPPCPCPVPLRGSAAWAKPILFAAPPQGEQGVIEYWCRICRICMSPQALPMPPAPPINHSTDTLFCIKIQSPFFAGQMCHICLK